MIQLTFEDVDLFDNEHQVFLPTLKGGTYRFEHSLRAIASWEESHLKPFLVKDEKTTQEIFDYFQCMCLDPGFDPRLIQVKQEEALVSYMAVQPSATTIKKDQGVPNGRFETSETIYATMVMMGIPFECQDWNIYRLFNMIEVISNRSSPKKKMTPHQIMEQNRTLNEQRKRQMHTKG